MANNVSPVIILHLKPINQLSSVLTANDNAGQAMAVGFKIMLNILDARASSLNTGLSLVQVSLIAQVITQRRLTRALEDVHHE